MQDETFTAVVIDVRHEAIDIVSVLLDAPGRPDIAACAPGSHIDVHAAGRTASFSLCGGPAEGARLRLAVQRTSRPDGVSRAVHAWKAGDRVSLGELRNHFALDGDGGWPILIAGGIGITPILSMAYALSAAGRRFDLHYCARSRAHAAFAREIEEASFADRLHFHFGGSASIDRFEAQRDLRAYARARPIFVCGPTRLIDDVIATARILGWRDDRIRYERFQAAASPDRPANAPFDVVLARAGTRFRVAADASIVDVLRGEGVFIPVSCGQGLCGTCATRVLDGIVDHRDSCLSPEDRESGGLMTPCCSRAASSMLVLDL